MKSCEYSNSGPCKWRCACLDGGIGYWAYNNFYKRLIMNPDIIQANQDQH